jgi:hypothetical protein
MLGRRRYLPGAKKHQVDPSRIHLSWVPGCPRTLCPLSIFADRTQDGQYGFDRDLPGPTAQSAVFAAKCALPGTIVEAPRAINHRS